MTSAPQKKAIKCGYFELGVFSSRQRPRLHSFAPGLPSFMPMPEAERTVFIGNGTQCCDSLHGFSPSQRPRLRGFTPSVRTLMPSLHNFTPTPDQPAADRLLFQNGVNILKPHCMLVKRFTSFLQSNASQSLPPYNCTIVVNSMSDR